MSDILKQSETTNGKYVSMRIDLNTKKNISDIFIKYSDSDDDYGFSKTAVEVQLLRVGEENLVSRSQAKKTCGKV